jgi:hypothetical protein
MVHRLELNLDSGMESDRVIAALPSVVGKVSLLGRFHPGKANSLKKRLLAVKQAATHITDKNLSTLKTLNLINPTLEPSIGDANPYSSLSSTSNSILSLKM